MIFEDKIIKKCSLEHNDSVSNYNGWGAQQNYNAFEVFHNFISETKPKRILEIGTSLGGFTCFLKYTSEKLGLDCDVLTYDIYDKPWYKELTDMGIDVRIKNVFSIGYTKVDQEVIDFVQSDGTTIVLCDGGDKIKEFNLISKYLKPNDFILAHDYAENEEKFNSNIKNKIWNWHEIEESDIINTCINNNLKDHQRDVFESVAWICKTKI